MKKLSIRAFIIFALLFIPIFVRAEVRDVTVYGTVHEGTLEKQILDQVNEQRRNAGVPELQMDLALTQAARQRAVEIGTYYDGRHLRTDLGAAVTIMNDFGISYYAFGENIAAGYSNVNTVMTEWINSTPHYNNIVNSRYSAIGIGVYQSSDGKWFWVQNFKDSLNTVYEPTGERSVSGNYPVRYEDSIRSSYTAESLSDKSLTVGDVDTITFHVTTYNEVTHSNVPLYLLDWESTNPNIVEVTTVNQTVSINAKSAGECTIQTVFGGVTYSFKVTVTGGEEPVGETPVLKVKLGGHTDYDSYNVESESLTIESASIHSVQNPDSISLYLCTDNNCDVKTYPSQITSTDEDVIRYFNEDFIFQNSGQATITAIFENGLHVQIPVEVYSYQFDQDAYNLFEGDSGTVQLSTDYQGNSTFTSSDSNIVEVLENGSILAKSQGEATITSLSDNGLIATTNVVVYSKDPIVINVNTENVELTEDETFAIIAQTNYEGATLSYRVEDSAIAEIDGNGNIKGLKEGNTTLTISATYTVAEGLVLSNEKTITVQVLAKEIAVEEIILTQESYELTVGETVDITVQIRPESASNPNLSWKSSDNSIVTVDGNGKVTAMNAGAAVVTVTASNGVYKDIPISVCEAGECSLRVDVSSIELIVGEEKEIHATGCDTLTWRSDNEEIATVLDGIITAIHNGSTTIYVSDGTSEISISVNVSEEIPITEIQVEQPELNLVEDDEVTLHANVYPLNTTNSLDLVWISNNENVVTVDSNGLVKAVGVGDTTIIITSVNGVRCEITVHVTKKSIPISNISVLEENVSLKEGETHPISVQVNPENTTEIYEIQYQSDCPDIASVDQDGIIHANAVGDAVITVTVNGRSATVSVFVTSSYVPIADIEVSRNQVGLIVGESTTITANVLPGITTENKSLIWTSNHENVVTVSQSGVITAKGVGQAIITITASNGVTKTIQVEVKNASQPAVVPTTHRTNPVVYSNPSQDEEEEKEETTVETHEFDLVFESNTFLLQYEQGEATLQIDELTDIDGIQVAKKEKVLAYYDIYLKSGDLSFDQATYHIHIPLTIDVDSYSKVYVASIVNGKVQEVFLSNIQDGIVEFTTDRLGEYAIVGVQKEKKDTSTTVEKTTTDDEQKPSTLKNILKYLLIILIIAACLVGARFIWNVFKEKKKND